MEKVKFTTFVAHAKANNSNIAKMTLVETAYSTNGENHLTIMGKDAQGVLLFEKVLVKSKSCRAANWTKEQYAQGSLYFLQGEDGPFVVIGASGAVATYGAEMEV